MRDRNYWQRMKRRTMSRRSLLRASARAGVGAAVTHPVGAGPFTFDNYIEGQELTATRFPDYWNAENIYFDHYSFEILPDSNTQWLAFLGGDHDVVRVPGSLAADADQMADIEDDGFSYWAMSRACSSKPGSTSIPAGRRS